MVELEIEDIASSEHVITSLEVTSGMAIPPLDYLKIFSPDSWEEVTLELVSYWKTQYSRVLRCGASGDMGRDVIAYSTSGNTNWENYQCKHYDKRLSLSDALLEIGKLLYYAFQKEFTVPVKYYFVSPLGVSNDLLKHLNDDGKLKAALIKKWESACKSKITTKRADDIELDRELLAFIHSVDFKIFDHIPPIKIIELHSKTVYHAKRFGINVKHRPKPNLPPSTLDPSELVYTEELLKAFSEAEGIPIHSLDSLEVGSDYKDEFDGSRKNFYSAENLQKFSRDWLPDNSYDELTDECFEAVSATVKQAHSNGYERYLATCAQAVAVNYTSHPLSPYIKTQDKKGMCHQLVNRHKFKWVRESKK